MGHKIGGFFLGTHHGFTILLLFMFAPAFIGSLMIAEQIQSRYFPIVSDFVVTGKHLNDKGDLVISGNFEKNFEDSTCIFRGLKWSAPKVVQSGKLHRPVLSADYGDRLKVETNNNRPKGVQYFHDWTIKTGIYPDRTFVTAESIHDCGIWSFRLKGLRTKLPAITLPKRPK